MQNGTPLLSKFFSTARACPDALFLDGSHQITYGIAAEEVTKRTKQLVEVAKGLPLILRGTNTAAWVLYFLAARAAGLTVIPLSTEVTTEQLHEFGELIGSYYLFDTAQDVGVLANAEHRHRTLPSDACICLPTSGSTGFPRLALRSEASILAEGERYVKIFELTAIDSILATLPLCHAFMLGFALAGTIAAGCALYLVPRFAPRTVQQLLRQGRLSILPLVPTAARLLCETFKDGGSLPQGLRHIIIGAGPVTPELEWNVTQLLGHLPARNYGCSETGATLGTKGQVVPDIVTGVPLPGVEVFIAGGTEPGALFVRTKEPFLGYLLPEGIDTSCISPDGWYSTGDLAIRDEQNWITVTGRIGGSLRRGGRFIHPTEVEQVLKTYPAVADALIVGGRDEHGEAVIEAHVEIRTGEEPTIDELRQHLEKRIETYKIPTVWHFHDTLPRTISGKPDRNRLRQPQSVEAKGDLALLSAVSTHRLSNAVIAAHRLGILAAIEGGKNRLEDIASALGLSRDGVEILLELLKTVGILTYNTNQGTYSAVASLSQPWINALIEFEDCLQQTWLSASAIEAAVRSEKGRLSSATELSATFSQMYLKVMGANAKTLALHAWRQVSLPQGTFLEIGCPAGAWTEAVRRRAPECHFIVFDLPPGSALLEFEPPKEPLAGIFIHNGVRRLAEPNCPLSLDSLSDALNPEGALIVSDIFIDAPSSKPWLRRALMLDWLTHGSLAWSRGADLCTALANQGFASIRRLHIDSMFDLIIAQNLSK